MRTTVSLINLSVRLVETEGQWHDLMPVDFVAHLLIICNSHVMTGSYHNYFRIYDVDGSSDVILQADKSAFKTKKACRFRAKRTRI